MIKDLPWTDRTNYVKMNIPSKAIYRFNIIPIKILMTKPERKIPKIHMEICKCECTCKCMLTHTHTTPKQS